jgi:hypothetical protein
MEENYSDAETICKLQTIFKSDFKLHVSNSIFSSGKEEGCQVPKQGKDPSWADHHPFGSRSLYK